MYSHTTRAITVTVQPIYLEDQSSPEEAHFVWAYHVKIENNGGTTVQLRNRYWRITDSLGRIQEVRGAGVVELPAVPATAARRWRLRARDGEARDEHLPAENAGRERSDRRDRATHKARRCREPSPHNASSGCTAIIKTTRAGRVEPGHYGRTAGCMLAMAT